jgi:hypothetical protein
MRRNELRGIAKRKGEWVVAQMDMGTSIRGVLTGVYADSVTLSHPTVLSEDGPDWSLGNDEAVLPRSRLLYFQVGPGVTKDATGGLA